MEEEALPVMLEAMWAANVVDIQNTLQAVCDRVLDVRFDPVVFLFARAAVNSHNAS